MSKWVRKGARAPREAPIGVFDSIIRATEGARDRLDARPVQVPPMPRAFPTGIEPRPHGEVYIAQRLALEKREVREDPETCLCRDAECICERELPPKSLPVCAACRSGKHVAEPPEGEAIPKKPRVAPMPWWMKGGKGA